MARKTLQYEGDENTLSGIKSEIKHVLVDSGVEVFREESTRLYGEQNTEVVIARSDKGWKVRIKSESGEIVNEIEDVVSSQQQTETTQSPKTTGSHEETDSVSVKITIDEEDTLKITDVEEGGEPERFDLDFAVIAGDNKISEGPSAVIFSDRFDWTEEEVLTFVNEVERTLMERI